jgi:IclR family acetate operon transcriptional repressor
MTTPDDESSNVGAVDKAISVVEAICDRGCHGVSEIAKELGMPKSTVHVHLKTLEDHGFIIQTDEGYQLALRFLDVGMKARDRFPIVEAARPELEELASETGETAWLAVEENGKCVFIDMVSDGRGLQARGQIGQHEHMHYLSVGKAILAHLPEERVSEIIDKHGLPQRTAETLVDEDALFDGLERIREKGYAVNDGDEVTGLYAVGAPIISGETVIGAISVSGPRTRLKRDNVDETIPELVLAATNAVELKSNY